MMSEQDAVIQTVHDAFSDSVYPGDAFLQGSFEGDEPDAVIVPFKGKTDWQQVDPKLLDQYSEALSFFSQAGLRFFLPAYLIADVQELLQTADPLFTLTHGFYDLAVEVPTRLGIVVRKTGKSAFVNPQRYGASTFYDYARWRLSVFTREEAQAIVAYLRYKKAVAAPLYNEAVDAALAEFWLDRAANAPSAADIKHHLKAEDDFMAAIRPDIFDSN
ncbi:MAG: hypothetical protein KDJ52_18750 [Anaerolineae bacterium]|nr:hypothetical protein [Anaerolineae bacterium]